MFRNKENEQPNNKSAFIAAGLVILLCLVSLTGATFALFTSNPEDGTIGIITTSGNVDIDIVDSEDDSLVTRSLKFWTTGKYSDGVLFEPGATFYTEGFKVKNLGNIPVNFRMYISEDESIDMDAFNEAFELYITKDPTNLGAAEKLDKFYGQLDAGGSSEFFYLVIRMKETAGNDFQDQTYNSIGITVCAVQGNVEIGE